MAQQKQIHNLEQKLNEKKNSDEERERMKK